MQHCADRAEALHTQKARLRGLMDYSSECLAMSGLTIRGVRSGIPLRTGEGLRGLASAHTARSFRR